MMEPEYEEWQADLPAQIIIAQDLDFVRRYPVAAFYLRVRHRDGTIEPVQLPGAINAEHARPLARKLGYKPTHCTQPGSSRPFPFSNHRRHGQGVSLETAASDFKLAINRFVEAYKARHLEDPEKYPLELPRNNPGLWRELMTAFHQSGTI